MKPTLIIDDKIPFIKGVFEPVATVHYCPGAQFPPELVKHADGLITRTRTLCNKTLLNRSSVKAIATATIGYDHIDIDYCKQNGIKWFRAAGCNANSVTQYIGSALLTLEQKLNIDLTQLTIGIVGIGNVGSGVLKLSQELGMKSFKNDPPIVDTLTDPNQIKEFCSLDAILEDADIITLHTPLTNTGDHPTHHLINEKVLEQLANRSKPVILINSSRGGVVDNEALKKILKNRNNMITVLDVWENEPNIDLDLLDLVDIATPHIAGYSADGKGNGTKMVVQQMSDFFDLGLDHWIPEIPDLPKYLSQHKPDFREILAHSYTIMIDNHKLRDHPEQFEALRGNYRIRREPDYFRSL